MTRVYVVFYGIFISSQIVKIQSHLSPVDHTDEDDSHYTTTSPVPPVSDHRFFLQEIFAKYGHEGQMTFEGFEHLLESLGLGNIIINDHDVGAHKNNPYLNIHDTHDHMKKIDHVNAAAHKSRESNWSSSEIHSTISGSLEKPSKQHFHNHPNILPSQTTTVITEATVITQPGDSVETIDADSGENNSNKVHLNDNLYHYQLKEVKIPELLVNISTLVDEHQEYQDTPPEIIIEQCLSPREILDAFGINQTSSLNPVSFLHLCPAIIYELDQGHCLFRDRAHVTVKSVPVFDQWLFSSVAVLIISLCGLFSVAVIPIMQKWFYHTLLQFLVGLAVGSLSGDALLHLMPHAMLGGENSHNHDNPLSVAETEKTAIWRGLAALFGIFFFFIAERVLAIYASRRKQRKENASSKKTVANLENAEKDSSNGNIGEKLSQYRKNSFHDEPTEKEMIKMLEVEKSRRPSCASLHSLEMNYEGSKNFGAEPNNTVVYSSEHSTANHGHGHSHEVPDSISAVAFMVIMGDGLHNFCDGLAIGTAFASGIEGGISTAVAVFCHELPHELGDFAMLLKTGMKVKEALLYNGLSSVLCFLGMVIGISLGNVETATSWVFAATAGMFIYIALADMLPELNTTGDSSITPMHLLAIQVLGICSGISIMLLIANYEQDLRSIIS